MRLITAVLTVVAFALAAMPATAGAGTVDQLAECSVGHDVEMLADQSVLVFGATGERCSYMNSEIRNPTGLALKLKPDGSVDTGYGDGGVTFLPPAFAFGAESFEVYPDGGVLMANRDGLIRLGPDGSPDRSFGNGGSLDFDFQTPGAGPISDVSLDYLGRILIVGSVSGPGEGKAPIAARLLADGTADQSFGTGGEAKPDLAAVAPGFSGSGERILATEEGGTLIAGFEGSDGYVVRLDDDGALDASWAAGETILRPWGSLLPYDFLTGFGGFVEEGDEFSLVLNYRSPGAPYPSKDAISATFDAAGIVVNVPPDSIGPNWDAIRYPDGRYLSAVDVLYSPRVELPPDFILGASPGLLGVLNAAGTTQWEVGASSSVARGVWLGPAGPGFATGAAGRDCEYLWVKNPDDARDYRLRGCEGTIIVKKIGGGVPFGESGFVSIPEIRCEYGEAPPSDTNFRVCLPPSRSHGIAARAKGKLRFTHLLRKRPGLKASFTVRPRPQVLRLRLPKRLQVAPTDRLAKRLKVRQGTKPVRFSRWTKHGIQLKLDPNSRANPVSITIRRGGLKAVPMAERPRRYRFRLSFRGRQYAYKWQRKVFTAKLRSRR